MAGTLHRTAWRRARQAALLPDTAQVIREVGTGPDGSGGWLTAPRTIATVACSLQTQSASASIGREVQEAGRLVAATLWVAYLPHGTDCGPADRLAVTDAAGSSKGTFEVVDSDDVRSDGVVMAVNLRRVK